MEETFEWGFFGGEFDKENGWSEFKENTIIHIYKGNTVFYGPALRHHTFDFAEEFPNMIAYEEVSDVDSIDLLYKEVD